MPYVNVPNDLSKIKTKIAFNLTKRQLVCLLQTVQQLQRREADRRSVSNVMELADRKRRSG